MAQGTKLYKRIPILSTLYRNARAAYADYRLRRKTPEQVFTHIYRRNRWHSQESVSGLGSELSQTRTIISAIPKFFQEFGIQSMLDIPCGDFAWMKELDWNRLAIDYLGADIVSGLIESNRQKHSLDNVRFEKLDLLQDALPTVDLILCRDCLVHFSFENIRTAIDNVIKSNSKYLMMTTFCDRKTNRDIATGKWRPINLERAPFELPPPMTIFNEGCTQDDGAYPDKSLGLWKISDIASKCPDFLLRASA